MGKKANIFADLPSNPLRYTSVFKALTGGDKVRAEAKFGKTFYFVNQAKLVFSANELPEVNDRTRAFWRRWQLIRFEQDFTGREDRELSAKLLSELPGILNWGLAGIPLLKEDKGFLIELGADDLKSEWRRRSETLAWFVGEEVIADAIERTPKDEFYEVYAAFCAANKAYLKPPEVVGKLLPLHVPSVRSTRERVNGELVRFWRGVCLKVKSGTGGQPPGTPGAPGTAARQEQFPDGSVPGVPSVPRNGTPAPEPGGAGA